jgi:hypothetical protein
LRVAALTVRLESERRGDRAADLLDPLARVVQDGLCLPGGGLAGVLQRRQHLAGGLRHGRLRVVLRGGRAAGGLRLGK